MPTAGGGPIGTGGGPPGGGHPSHSYRGRPSVTSVSIAHLGSGTATLRLKVLKGAGAPGIRSIAIELPHGLTFRHGRRLTRAQVFGASLRSVRLVRGRLLIALKAAVGRFTVHVQGIRESAALKRRARHHRLRHLTLGFGIVDASGHGSLVRVVARALSL
jgi:hypothetical protein